MTTVMTKLPILCETMKSKFLLFLKGRTLYNTRTKPSQGYKRHIIQICGVEYGKK